MTNRIKATEIPAPEQILEIAYHMTTSHLGGGAASNMNKAMNSIISKQGLDLMGMANVLDKTKHEGINFGNDVAIIWSDYNDLMDEMMSYANDVAKWAKQEIEIEAAMNEDN